MVFRKREPSQFIDHFCHWDDALKRHMVCSEFYFAQLKEEIVPDKYLGTWVIPGSAPRTMSFAAKWAAYQQDRDVDDHSGDLYSHWDCPFCGGEACPIPVPRIAGSNE